MLFKKDILAGIAAGKITLAFRRWRRPGVKPGSRLHTPAGLVEIGSMTVITEAEIREAEVQQAGYDSLAELLKELNRYSKEGTVYRIELARIGDDPRETLREDTQLEAAQYAELQERLERLDRASAQGPWTIVFLQLIARHPGVRAGDLAGEIDWDPDKLKLNVRKLKNLGLTISLGTGYRISPRGQAYMDQAGL